MEVNTVGNCKSLKYALGRGNNILLVQLALKNRWWWHKTKRSNPGVNFLWTQLMCRKYISGLDSLNEKGQTSDSELNSTAWGSISQIKLKETTSNQDSKTTSLSSLTTSQNVFPSQKISRVQGFGSSNPK